MPAIKISPGAAGSAPNRAGRTEPLAPRRRVRVGRLARLFTPPAGRRPYRCRDPYGEVGQGTAEVVLDARELPIEGLEGRTLERMEVLPQGARLRLLSSLIHWPLFAMLETRGYRYRLVGRKDGAVHILVWASPPAR